MCSVGDVVRIFSPVAGYDKYHLCIKAPDDDSVGFFLFLNSDPNFQELYVVNCDRLPFLPPSKTGKTAFSFSMIPKYNRRQLKLFKATILGRIDEQLAHELWMHAKTLTVLSSAEKTLVVRALNSLI